MAYIINLDTRVKKNDSSVMSNELGDELVIMDTESGNYIGLNKIGYVIWQLLDKHAQVRQLVNELANKYEVTSAECEADTIAYLEKMASLKLISIS